MASLRIRILLVLSAGVAVWDLGSSISAQARPSSDTQLRRLGPEVVITAADCTSAKTGTTIAPSAIGAPVSGVTLSSPIWVEAAAPVPAHCRVNGSIAPVDTTSTARPSTGAARRCHRFLTRRTRTCRRSRNEAAR
jgi:hypothetical protein